MLAALVRPISTTDRETARAQLSEAVATLEGRLPKVAAMLEAARGDGARLLGLPDRSPDSSRCKCPQQTARQRRHPPARILEE